MGQFWWACGNVLLSIVGNFPDMAVWKCPLGQMEPEKIRFGPIGEFKIFCTVQNNCCNSCPGQIGWNAIAAIWLTSIHILILYLFFFCILCFLSPCCKYFYNSARLQKVVSSCKSHSYQLQAPRTLKVFEKEKNIKNNEKSQISYFG